MKMELTNELKERFFAQYIGETILCDGQIWILKGISIINTKDSCTLTLYNAQNGYINYDSDLCTLELRPPSSITEEEAIELYYFMYGKDSDEPRHVSLKWAFNNCMNSQVDWARSKGFLVPFMKISTVQWIEWGVVKLKEA